MFNFLDQLKLIYLRGLTVLFSSYRRPLKSLINSSPCESNSKLLSIEIVSHCWKYSHLLVYQLSSLVLNEPRESLVKMTVLYSDEDLKTTELLRVFENYKLENVRWNFVSMDKHYLFRRSIGRNIAAKRSSSDWVWFTDCDVLFFPGSLDALSRALNNCVYPLVFPSEIMYTDLLQENHPILQKGLIAAKVTPLPHLGNFFIFKCKKAMGPIQIVRGDIAAKYGYCEEISLLQKPAKSWKKAYEDQIFRWLLGTNGVPIDVPNIAVIRHESKGRYRNSISSSLRTANRRLKEYLRNWGVGE